jgi:hypothetical protein
MEDSDYDQVEYEEAGGLGLTEPAPKIVPIRYYSQPSKSTRSKLSESFLEDDFNQFKRQFNQTEVLTVTDSKDRNSQGSNSNEKSVKDTTKGRVTRTYLRTSPTMPRPRGISISKAKLKTSSRETIVRRKSEISLNKLRIETDEQEYSSDLVSSSSASAVRAEQFNFNLSRDALIERKFDLDRLSSKVERGSESYRPIKDKRDKSKGFLSWLGGLIGCGERN